MEVTDGGIDRQEWSRLTMNASDLSLMQTWTYGEVRGALPGWRAIRAVVRDRGRAVAAVQGLLRRLPVIGGGLLWINRGPLLLSDGIRLPEVLSVLGQWAARWRWYVRLAPPIRQEQFSDASIAGTGFRRTSTGGWCSMVVDLTIAADELRARLDQKWRNSLNKSVRLGVTVQATAEEAAVRRYADGLGERLRRTPFQTTVTPDFLLRFRELMSGQDEMLVLEAVQDGNHLGSNVLACYGTTAEYLSGYLNDAGRSMSAGHALLWSAITETQRRGHRRFDLGGVHPERTPKGIHHFKKGVGGEPYCLAPEIETEQSDWRSRLVRWRVDATRRDEGIGA